MTQNGISMKVIPLFICAISNFQQSSEPDVFAVAGHGEFADQQIAGALQHLLLPEGKRLGLVEGDQVLQHAGDFYERSGAHALGVLFEPVFPVAIGAVPVDRKQVQHFLDFPVLHHPPQTDTPGVLAGHHHSEAAGFNVQEVEPLDRRTHGPAADLFDDTDTMVGIDDFITYVEIRIGKAHKQGTQSAEG